LCFIRGRVYAFYGFSLRYEKEFPMKRLTRTYAALKDARRSSFSDWDQIRATERMALKKSVPKSVISLNPHSFRNS
jgi:hypothetical protein